MEKSFNKNAQNCSLWRVVENMKHEGSQCYQTGQLDNWTKNDGKCQNSKIQMQHFESFSNNMAIKCSSLERE